MSPPGNTAVPASERKANVAVVRRFYEAVSPPCLSSSAPDRVARPESLPWGGTFRGHDGFREFSARVADRIAEFRPEKQQYLDAGKRVVVVLLRSIGRAKGGTGWDLPEVHVWTVRDSKAVSFDNYVDTAIVLRTCRT